MTCFQAVRICDFVHCAAYLDRSGIGIVFRIGVTQYPLLAPCHSSHAISPYGVVAGKFITRTNCGLQGVADVEAVIWHTPLTLIWSMSIHPTAQPSFIPLATFLNVVSIPTESLE